MLGFSAFFNINQLKKIPSNYGLRFLNRIHILPGLKTIRIYGTADYTQQHRKKRETINKSIAQDEDDTSKAVNNCRSDLEIALLSSQVLPTRFTSTSWARQHPYLETLFKERRKELDQLVSRVFML